MKSKNSYCTDIQTIMTYCKSKGFIYQNSEIYGGLSNTWDYGPLGVEIKKTIKQLWWSYFIDSRLDMVGVDTSILMNPKVWEASKHTETFSDPLVDCKLCQSRLRADHLVKSQLNIDTQDFGLVELQELLTNRQAELTCSVCQEKAEFTNIREFNLMFKTFQGVTKETANEIYLRPETAQGIFVNFKNILQTTRKKIPFGVGQIGKSFRNEITPGQFIFRTREFEQMEIEYFIHPEDKDKFFQQWVDLSYHFFTDILGIEASNLQLRKQTVKELAHYSDQTTDIEFYFGEDFWGEVAGIASRQDYDLTLHQKSSQEDLSYFDPTTRQKYTPFVIEPSFGVDRAFLSVLMNAYSQEQLEDGKMRTVLKIKPVLAPFFVAVLPLKKNEENIVELSKQIISLLSVHYKVMYDDTGSIGKLYRRQDEIGTPFCITVDFQSLEDKTVTLRERDSMKQERIHMNDLKNYLDPYFYSKENH